MAHTHLVIRRTCDSFTHLPKGFGLKTWLSNIHPSKSRTSKRSVQRIGRIPFWILNLYGLIGVNVAMAQALSNTHTLGQTSRSSEMFALGPKQSSVRLPKPAQPLRKQARGQTLLQSISGLQVSEVMTGLGEISDLELSPSGDIFVSDAQNGRVWALSDRGQDGKLDGRRPICGLFKTPSGLAAHSEDVLFIADLDAIWRCNPKTGLRDEYVSLRGLQSQKDRGWALSPKANQPSSAPQTFMQSRAKSSLRLALRPMDFAPKDRALLIGITDFDSQSQELSRLIRIDPLSRQATILSRFNAPITVISTRPQGDIWLGVGPYIMEYQGGIVQRMEGFEHSQNTAPHDVGGLILPGQFKTPEKWPQALKDHILVSQSGPYTLPQSSSGGMNIMAVPTEFGRPQNKAKVFVDGFLTQRKNAAWGRPTAMIIDMRGLFFADSWSGRLWRVAPQSDFVSGKPVQEKPAQKQVEKQKTEQEYAALELKAAKEKTQAAAKLKGSQIQGSSISQGSSILQGSQIEVGSYLLKAYDEKKAQEEQAKRDAEKAKRLQKNWSPNISARAEAERDPEP